MAGIKVIRRLPLDTVNGDFQRSFLLSEEAYRAAPDTALGFLLRIFPWSLHLFIALLSLTTQDPSALRTPFFQIEKNNAENQTEQTSPPGQTHRHPPPLLPRQTHRPPLAAFSLCSIPRAVSSFSLLCQSKACGTATSVLFLPNSFSPPSATLLFHLLAMLQLVARFPPVPPFYFVIHWLQSFVCPCRAARGHRCIRGSACLCTPQKGDVCPSSPHMQNPGQSDVELNEKLHE